MMMYEVHAIDEFGRKFGSSRAFGQDIEDLKFEGVASIIFQRGVWDILKLMGTAAMAEWWGESYAPSWLRPEDESLR